MIIWKSDTLACPRETAELPSVEFISNSKRSNFENRTEWAESRGLERNGSSENNGEILRVVSPELKL
jgi:hypothetical protein